jgi:hypothetical protein
MLTRLCYARHAKYAGELSAAEVYAEAKRAGLWSPDKSKAEMHDRSNCMRRAERMLAGTGVLAKLIDPNTGAKKFASLRDDVGARVGRSQVYFVTGRSDHDPLPETDIPI